MMAWTMAPALPSAVRKGGTGPTLLILTTTFALLLFYYLTRADTIGVFSASRGWTAMTTKPLSTALHFITAAVLLGVVPVLVACATTGLSLRRLGLGLGDWRRGLALLALGTPLALLAALAAVVLVAMPSLGSPPRPRDLLLRACLMTGVNVSDQLGGLAGCTWRALRLWVLACLDDEAAVPGDVGFIQTSGELLNFHPHIHLLITAGVFCKAPGDPPDRVIRHRHHTPVLTART